MELWGEKLGTESLLLPSFKYRLQLPSDSPFAQLQTTKYPIASSVISNKKLSNYTRSLD
jgi:hypothetical protein